MAKYRKRPIVVEAEQFIKSKLWPFGVKYNDQGYIVIKTLEGDMSVSEGDWIITGIRGEKYPCKPDIFKATYERVLSDCHLTHED